MTETVRIRHAVPADIELCLQLDGSFDTERVWQLELRDHRDRFTVQIRATELPRQLRVDYPTPHNALLMHWQRGYCILVAEDPLSAQVLGYVDVGPEPDLQMGWIWHLVVDRQARRQGIGSKLLRVAKEWSRGHNLRRLVAPLQTQNDPGIRFSQRHGLVFYGFNDSFYRNRGIALFFGCDLR